MTGSDDTLAITDWAAIVAGVVAALALADYVRSLWRRTAGRRREVARRLRRLGTGAQVQFFESVLGEPPAMRRTFVRQQEDWGAVVDAEDAEDCPDPPIVEREFTESFWIDPDYCVQTVNDREDSVVGFSITTRSRRFRPTIYFPLPPTSRTRLAQILTFGRRRPWYLAKVKLGRTTFADAFTDDWGYPGIRSWLGARAWSYSEVRYCGNPGHYQDIALTMSSAGAVSSGDPTTIESVEPDDDPWVDLDEAPDDWLEAAPSWIKDLHAHGVVTTVTIIGGFPAKDWPTFGPHGDEIRTLP